jgi:uncharacterized membrane protein YraQ (UPF0718 family)
MRLPLLLFALLGTLTVAHAAGPSLVLHGHVRRAVTKSAIADGEVELRLPGHEDSFAPLTAPLRKDGSYELKVPFADLPERKSDLTLSVLAEGFDPVEKPLVFPEGVGLPETMKVDFVLAASTLDGVIDIFSCCVLSWAVLTVMLPAFLLGAAITAFVPSQYLLRLLGPAAPKPMAYGAAIASGMVLSLCSCNVVPLFVSIWAGGAGIGPAFAFLYAGPAINLVSTAFTCKVIGTGIGIFRVVSVAIIALIVGLVMSRIFGERKEGLRVAQAPVGVLSMGPSGRVTSLVIGLLLYLLVVGALDVSLKVSLLLTIPAVVGLILVGIFGLQRDHLLMWARQTRSLIMLVVPILIPAVLIIGFAAQHVPLTATRWLSGSNGIAQNLAAGTFGSLMYFPILTEVPFVKTMLKVMGMGIGPGMALLLTAPGLSLPGMIIVSREIGWKRLSVYVVCILLLASLTGWFFGSEWGAYICNCQL